MTHPTCPPITIVLADAEHMIRTGLRCLLDRQRDFQVVGEVADGLEVVRRVGRLRPRVAVLEVALPGLDGLEVTRRIRESLPETEVVVVSRYTDPARVATALRHGAAGFVAKQASEADLCNAVRRAVVGKRSFGLPIGSARTAGTDGMDPYGTLTPRQREVLQLTAEGHSRADIARRLGISPRTSEEHRANAMTKLGLRDRVEVVRYALSRGILARSGGPDPWRPKRRDRPIPCNARGQ